MGGLSKRAFLIDQYREKKGATVLVDGGNILFTTRKKEKILAQDILSAEAIIDVYNTINYDAMAIGPHDLTLGYENLIHSLHSGTPWVSANLFDLNENLLFPPYVVKDTNAGKIGIIGLTSALSKSDGIEVRPWEEVLPAHIEQLTPLCNFIILLSNLDSESNSAIANQYQEIHLLISANAKLGNSPPNLLHNTLLTQTHSRGKYLGKLDIQWPPSHIWQETDTSSQEGNKKGTFMFKFKSLPPHIKESSTISKRIKLLNEDIASQNKQSSMNKDQSKNTMGDGAKILKSYTGASSCRECHSKQYEAWKMTKHSSSMKSLKNQGQQYNLKCLECHVTLYREGKNPDITEINLLQLPQDLRMVGCESCHGPAIKHVASEGEFPLISVSESTCRQCHTREMDSNFQYSEKLNHLGCIKH